MGIKGISVHRKNKQISDGFIIFTIFMNADSYASKKRLIRRF